MGKSECSDFPVKKKIEKEDVDLNSTEIKSENISQKTKSSKIYKCEFCHYKSQQKGKVSSYEEQNSL